MFARQTLCLSFFLFSLLTLSVFLFLIIYDFPENRYQLQKIVILSRHNLRTPLSRNLNKITPFTWPVWQEKPGFLTKKGFILEGYMGTFFRYWLNTHGLLPSGCPSEKDFYVYANNMQRTIASAEAFCTNAFPNCNITINHSMENYDPIFSPYIHNNTPIFRKIAMKEMNAVLQTFNLKTGYEAMENILDYHASDMCQIDKKCDMITEKNKFNITAGKKPSVSGPLKLCNEVIDAFMMEYYSGFPIGNVAWGKLSELSDWQSILPLTNAYHNITYNTTHVARDIAEPLLKYIYDLFLNDNSKITLLMGHDANINVILNALQFHYFFLKNEFVLTPIGGKIVFQKWQDLKNKEYLLKINYIYQSIDQLRNNVLLSESVPPKFNLLELKHCKMDNNGFCPWDVFISMLKNIVNTKY